MKLSLFLWTVLPVAATVGCTYNYRGYGYATPEMLAPTSYSPAPRVYSVSMSTGIVITPGEIDDLSLANSIRNILAKDTHLYRNVDVSIVKGFVKLRGVVPRVQDGERLCDEIAAVPGVASVENQLGITHLSTLDSMERKANSCFFVRINSESNLLLPRQSKPWPA